MPLAFSSGFPHVPCSGARVALGASDPHGGSCLHPGVLLLQESQCSRQARVLGGPDLSPSPPSPAGVGDVHPGPAAVPQGERRQVEATVSADSRCHPPDVSQAAGLSPFCLVALGSLGHLPKCHRFLEEAALGIAISLNFNRFSL